MAKTGLTNKVITRLERNWESHQLLANSKEAKVHNEELKETLQLLKDVHASRDIKLALGVEQLFLHQERANYANSPEESNSVKAALEQFSDAKKSLSIVQNPQAYQNATETYSGKRKEAGLPIDSFREFLKSHTTRLSNRMASPLSVPEKNLLRQRKENLKMVKEVYMGMQRQALGIPEPLQEKGVGL